MVYAVAGIVLTGLLAALALLFVVVLARRLRRVEDTLSRFPAPPGRRDPVLPPGTVVADFTVTDVEGRPVSRDAADRNTLVAFLTPGCPPCEDLLPLLADRVAAGAERVVAVVATRAPSGVERYRVALGPNATVVAAVRGPVFEAFGTAGFPAVYVLERGGRVRASAVGDAACRIVSSTPVPAHVG